VIMGYRRLFLCVEGGDDDRFFKNVIAPTYQQDYDLVQVTPYRNWGRRKVDAFLASVKAMNADYIFVADINSAPCITARKEEIQALYRNADEDRIVVVVKEIEGWYLAGLDASNCRRLGLRPLRNTDDITKEDFGRLMPSRYDSRIDFMAEILGCFATAIAKRKNRSFRYLAAKYSCPMSADNSPQ